MPSFLHTAARRTPTWLLCGWLVLGGPVSAEELDAGAVLAGFQTWLDGTRDLEARFDQRLVSGALGSGLEEHGRVYLLRPGRMRWDYLDPERKVALIDGMKTVLYVEEDRQLWEGRLDDTGSWLPTVLTSDRPLAELFEATLEAAPGEGGKAYLLRLDPLGDTEELRYVVLRLRPPAFAVEEAEVLDGAGNRMIYRFRAVHRNRGLAPARFRFEPPPGTEIMARH